MATTHAGSATLLSTVFADPFYTRQVAEWLPRAAADDKARFERVFGGGPIEIDPPALPAPPLPAAAPAHPGWTHVSTKAAQARAASMHAAPPRPERPSSGRAAQQAEPQTGAEQRQLQRQEQRPQLRQEQQQQQQQQQQQEEDEKAPLNNRELASLLKAQKARQERIGSGRGRPSQEEHKSPNCTIYHSSYNVRDDHPEMFAEAVASTRSEPVPNFTFVSDWGDSLKRDSDPVWRERFMKSTYQAANDNTYAGFVTDYDLTKERTFYDWMQKQRTYYGDLMHPEKKKAFEAAFDAASIEQKREILEGLRQVTSVVQPDQLKSHSHTAHCFMAKTENPELVAMTHDMVRVKTMGMPPPIIRTEDLPPPGQRMPPDAFTGGSRVGGLGGQLRQKQRPASASVVRMGFAGGDASAAGAGAGAGPSAAARPASAAPKLSYAQQQQQQQQRPSTAGPPEAMRPLSAIAARQTQLLNAAGGGGVHGHQRPASAAQLGAHRRSKPKKAVVEIDTFKSTVPLKWPGMIVAGGSAYTDAYGSPGLRRHTSGSQHQAVRYKEVTAPMGAVNKHTALVPAREAYPVPECYVQQLPFPLPRDDITSDTTYRQDFYLRSEADTLRTMRGAAINMANTKQEAIRTEIPLGPKNGYNTNPSSRWVSDHHDNYIKFTVDVQRDRERARALRAAVSGPTASTGAVAGAWPPPKPPRGPAAEPLASTL